ncbi:Ulp1 protease family [Vigna unguiculata]|uniref:Ulp1 protease family n=1 Tax=Vigna unguiculata TaxID=3917 RepID=A0A4D6KSQ5_VIGUN|nr:Ulp1 protease family [Vigna unguiculata]
MEKIVSIFLDNGVIDKFVVAPINTSQHWVLLAINIKMEIIYYLDPLHNDINMRQDLKKLFDM